MAAPVASVTGLSSGLDTNKIITELMSIEQAPMTRMQASVTAYQNQVSAWTTVRGALSALQSAAAALTNSSNIGAMVTATTSSGAAAATVTGTPALGAVSFTIDQLAAAHQAASASTFSGGADLVGAGTFSLTVGSTTTPYTTTAGTTLSQLASQINASNAGVAAAVVAVDASTSKLVLTATAMGAAAAFTASGTQASLATFNVLQQGKDAHITIGTGVNAIQLTRPSNQISDLISGVSIGLTALSATPVSVTVAQDPTAVVKAVQGVVNAYNAAYSTLSQFTSYDPTSKTAGVLLDDPTASGLLGQLNQVLADQVKGLGGSYTSASSIGITMQADGTFALDTGKLTTALATNPSAVTTLLARSGSATDSRIASVNGTDATSGGSYAVVVSQAAQAAIAISGAYPSSPPPNTFTVTSNGVTATVTAPPGADLATILTLINGALKTAGITQLSASASGSGFQIQSSVYGASTKFTVAGDTSFGLNGTYAGVNVAGTINGQAASGTGQVLSSSTGASSGLQVKVVATPADVAGAGGTLSLGSATFSQGVAGRLSSFVNNATGPTGTITDASAAYSSQIDTVKQQMAALQVQLNEKETVLRQRFAAMETALLQLQGQGNFMNAQFGTTTTASTAGTGSNTTASSSSSGG
jgi:flagellar hook-associated protein 2